MQFVRTSNGADMGLRRLVALFALLCLGAASQDFSVRYEPRHFSDCRAAALYAAEHPLAGSYQYRLSGTLTGASMDHVPRLGWRATARVAYSFVRSDSVMRLPQWTWPRMTSAERAYLRDFNTAIKNHELGHRIIALRALGGAPSEITVIGGSPGAAASALHSALSVDLRTTYAEILRAENLYDRVTDHGRQQADASQYDFPGGPDTVFRCR